MSDANEKECSEKKLIEAPYIDQSVRYPTGCESVSAVMLLQYLGYEITVDEFIEQYLEKREFEERDGELYGPDPSKQFCGSPYDPDAYGCYAPVICKALKKAAGREFEFADESGAELEELLHTYIDEQMPVIFWACINMDEPVIGPQWKLLDTGEIFTWTSREHCMLLVGYDEQNCYFNDPYENHGLIAYPRELVEKRYKAQKMQAVGTRPKKM